MLVSGGQILAIDKVNTGNTILGDGVQKPLDVNTDLIATTSSVSSVSSVLEQQIDSVSSNFQYYYKKSQTSGADEISNALLLKQDVSAMSAYATSALVDENYQKKGNYVTSAGDELAGKQLVLKDNEWQELEETNWTDKIAEASAAAVTSAKNYTDTKLEDYYKQNETSSKDELEEEFAKYQLKGDYLSANALDDISGKWESVYDTVTTASGSWNEASAFAANSAKFVTSAGVEFNPDLAYFLKKQEENVVWSGVDLSNLGKMYNISSTTPELISAGISTDEQNNPFYVISAAKPREVAIPGISGENGVSAQYDEATSAWLVGLEQANSATYMGTQSTQTTLTADATLANPETLSGFGINTQIYGHDIAVTTDTVTLEKGMYHVDLQIDVTVPGGDPSYYTTTIKPTLSNSVLTHVIDGSFAHTETLDLSFIIDADTATNAASLQFQMYDLPAGASYIVKNLQICELVTVDSELHSEGGAYTGGDAIAIDAQNKINVKYDSASGLGLNANGQLVVKLGKGLQFDDTEGAVEGTLILDGVTEEVVETVQELQVELERKLTANMNVSDAKKVGNPFYSGSTPCIGAALFTVSLNHKLNTDSEVSFFTSQAMNQNNSFPIMIGILEYDFAYMDPVEGKRARTKWIGDTGLIWPDTPAVDGNTIGDNAPDANRKYTFKLKNLTPVIEEEVTIGGVKYINKVGPELRSDRAYYMVMFSRAPQGLSYFLSDEGYETTTNSNPLLSFYCTNMNYYEYDGAEGQIMSQWSDATWQSHANDLAMSAIDFWHRGGEANAIYRPFVMIRNNV